SAQFATAPLPAATRRRLRLQHEEEEYQVFLRSFRYLAALCALLVLAACGTSGTPTPPEPEQATVEEAVDAVDTLVADIVAVASGLMSNDTFAGLMDYECDPYCTWPEDVEM